MTPAQKKAKALMKQLTDNFESGKSDSWNLVLLDAFLSDVYQFLHDIEKGYL